MTTSQRDALNNPVSGLLIYSTSIQALTIYSSTGWFELKSEQVSVNSGGISTGNGVAINNVGASPDSSAILDVSSTEKGLLLPRVNDTSSVLSPALGLLIFNKNINKLSYFDGSNWVTPCVDFVGNNFGTNIPSEYGVAVNKTGNDPDPSAILDIDADDLGFLIPRLTDAERDLIKPKEGLLIYNVSSGKINFWDNNGWEEITTTPPPAPSSIVGVSSVCQGESGINFSINSVPGLTYNWNYSGVGGNIVSGQGTNSVDIDFSASATSGTLSVTAANSCGEGLSSDFDITVIPYLGAANNITDTSAICENSTKELTGAPVGGIWAIVSGGGTISGSTYTPDNVSSTVSVTISYTVPSNGTCPSTTSNVTFNVGEEITTIANTTDNSSICVGQTKDLIGSPSGGIWTIVSGGGTVSGNTYTPSNVMTSTNVTINYTINGNPGCADLVSNNVEFTVNPNPGSATNNTASTEICENDTKLLVGTPSGGTWSVTSGGGTISGNTYTPADVSSNTIVSVVYTTPASGGCAATTSSVSFDVNNNVRDQQIMYLL